MRHQYGRSELPAVSKTDDASSITAVGCLHLSHIYEWTNEQKDHFPITFLSYPRC